LHCEEDNGCNKWFNIYASSAPTAKKLKEHLDFIEDLHKKIAKFLSTNW
jgi:hypothetical protein